MPTLVNAAVSGYVMARWPTGVRAAPRDSQPRPQGLKRVAGRPGLRPQRAISPNRKE